MAFSTLFTGAVVITALSSSVFAQSIPADLDIAAIVAAGPPPTPTIASNVPAQTVVYNANAVEASAAAEQSAAATDSVATKVKRAACDPQLSGAGPVPTPDTDQAFLSLADFSSAASAAPTPSGYVVSCSFLMSLGDELRADLISEHVQESQGYEQRSRLHGIHIDG